MLTKSERSEHDSDLALSLGQRERNKRDKLMRIKNAARALFVSKGYDDTTTREIALRAGVGMGTVFTYADNKRDLLFLIANEDLEITTRRAKARLSAELSLMTNLLVIFRNHYEFFFQQPELSRLMLREMLFYDSGQQADRFKTTRDDLISLIGEAVRMAKAEKEIRTTADHREIGWMLFCIYQVELRNWLAEGAMNLDKALINLARLLHIALSGVAPKVTALKMQKLPKLKAAAKRKT